MCEILNKYFISVFTLERPESLMEIGFISKRLASNLNKILITEEIVLLYAKMAVCYFPKLDNILRFF